MKHKQSNGDVDTDIVARFGRYLTDNGKRRTPERDALVTVIASLKKVFTLDMLVEALKSSDIGSLSTSTVYSNLDLLVETGIITRLHFDGLPVHYIVTPELPQSYLVCTSCGRVKTVTDKHLIAFMNTRRYPAFSASSYSLTLYGTCNGCARRQRRQEIKP